MIIVMIHNTVTQNFSLYAERFDQNQPVEKIFEFDFSRWCCFTKNLLFKNSKIQTSTNRKHLIKGNSFVLFAIVIRQLSCWLAVRSHDTDGHHVDFDSERWVFSLVLIGNNRSVSWPLAKLISIVRVVMCVIHALCMFENRNLWLDCIKQISSR